MGDRRESDGVRMRRPSDRAPLLLAAICVLAAPGIGAGADASAGETRSMTVVAEGSGCPGHGHRCYEVANASADLAAGDRVTVTFANEGRERHTLYVANGSNVEDHRDTPAGVALAGSGEVPPGERTRVNFTVPDGDQVYFWCDRSGHEADGMWAQVPVGASSENATTPGQGAERVRFPLAAGLLAVAAAAVLLARRRG